MSVFVHHPLSGVGILVALVGIWISFRDRAPKRSFASTFGDAVFQLGMTISAITAITTAVPIDSWSTGDWIVGVVIVMSLSLTVFLFGIAHEMRRQKKPGAGNPQRVGTGFSPR